MVVAVVVVVAVVAVAVPLQSSGLAAGLIRTVSLSSHASGPPYHVCAPSSPSSPFSSPSCALSSHACAPSPPHCYPRAATAHEPAFGPSAAVLLRSNRLHRLPRPPPSVQRRSTASRAWPRRSATPAFSHSWGDIERAVAARPVGAAYGFNRFQPVLESTLVRGMAGQQPTRHRWADLLEEQLEPLQVHRLIAESVAAREAALMRDPSLGDGPDAADSSRPSPLGRGALKDFSRCSSRCSCSP